MTAGVQGRLERLLAGAGRCLVLSPHLDDAVLSCGALLSVVSGVCPVTVATVFTEPTAPPHTRAGRSFLRASGFDSAAALYRERQREDREVLADLGVATVHLGFPDALFRRRSFRDGRHPGAGLVRAVPELAHRYPTYRFDIARGRVAAGDSGVIATVAERVRELVSREQPTVILAPLGIGRHVDHLIVRRVATEHGPRVGYYSDFPYVLTAAASPEFVAERRLRPWVFDRGLERKRRLVAGYRTQVGGLFPDGVVPLVPEVYELPSSDHIVAAGNRGRGPFV